MKRRLFIISLVSVALGTVLWSGSKQLADQKLKHERAMQMVAELKPQSPGPPMNESRPSRLSALVASKGIFLTPETLEFLRDVDAAQIKGGPKVENWAERSKKLEEKVNALDPVQVRALVKILLSPGDLSQNSRTSLARLLIQSAIAKAPLEAIDLIVELKSLLGGMEQWSIAGAVMAAAEQDSGRALDWIRKANVERPELLSEEAKAGVIKVIAKKDPKLALALIAELNLDYPSNVTQQMVSNAVTAEEKVAVLKLLREYAAEKKNGNARFQGLDYALAVMGRSFAGEGFDKAVQWAEEMKMTPWEAASFASDLTDSIKPGEQGKWLEWMGKKAAPKNLGHGVRSLINFWAERDYKAVADWLNTTPSGNMKIIAVAAYAQHIFPAEQEAGVQWATTLPPGQLRDDTLHKLFHRWPIKDEASKAAAAEFEKKYEIKHSH